MTSGSGWPPVGVTAREIAVPRLTGSAGSAVVRAFIRDRFTALGFTVLSQPFGVDIRPHDRNLRIALSLVGVGLATASTGTEMAALRLAGLLATLAGGALAAVTLRNGPILLEGTCTENLVARRRGLQPPARVLVVAHHDSKSQNVSFVGRILLTLLLTGSLALSAGLFLIGWPRTPWLAVALATVTWAGAASALALATMASGNVSPGGLDNAGSVAVALRAAEAVGAEAFSPDVAIVLTGAEEQYLAGARALLKNGDATARQPAFVINLDGVGGQGPMGVSGSSRLTALVLDRAVTLGVPMERLRTPLWMTTDAMAFARAGIPAVTLSSARLSRSVLTIHGRGDTADHLCEDALVQATRLIASLCQSPPEWPPKQKGREPA